ncbi:Serine/threonine-protein kinase [Ophidiomyces ophidiicola]|uniref:Serine/threonine-protein kinase n=1 Tax=Ophidiomyces ophidiicola TaxID=1387563 RepID=A0ACB8UWJ7_9EURO|nr:Serine/threonine-protein kinase [Ophidiomyces ophidiicola]KAI1914438.1 Serine/threonine-protein kinase [Ophidiomyces ophidiicola]KAI1931239.1 Serine/threonine-protein kinase [Ophidiomyces ophidiicola]KAI1956767.1 Serine/threonine-protein kinase [Ophidiomyces ophidiicola]KAI1974609.1 Serine/threonine-protein kinase [Ophidiomyces ophidiicola]
MDPNSGNNENNYNDRFYGFNDRPYTAANARAYPTTPSTFPQPMYQNQGGHEYATAQNAPNAYNQGYFGNNPYAQQAPHPQQFMHPNVAPPQPGYQPRAGGYLPNDGTSGLIQQFSNQDLGGSPRGAAAARVPPQGQRPRTAGSPALNQGPGHLAPPMSSRSPKQATEEEELVRCPEKYSENVHKRGKAAKELVNVFFRENIERARDRNLRAVNLDKVLQNNTVSDARKRHEAETVAKKESNFLRFIRTRETVSNFQTLKIIGKGAFGEVKLVQRKSDGKIYALKSLIKSEMFKKDQLAHVRAERDILADSKDNPWLVKLHASFQDKAYLYLLMEFLPGGDLMTMLIKYEIFSEDITRFYMAELVMAIEAVHKLGFLHRDIKPDNILLDRGGHIKLTDFGLSTGGKKQHDNSYYQQLLKNTSASKDKNRNSGFFNDAINLTVSNRGQINTWRKSRRAMAYSTVGTPDYIAPEIFNGQGYTYLCDWWSVGAIMFECLIGWPPFCTEQQNDVYRKILNWKECLYFPEEMTLSRDSEHLIRSFLCDPEDRIGQEGGQHGGANQIKNHPFFRGVVWDQLRKIRAPFEPRLTSNVDVSYFPIDEIPQEDNSAQLRAQARAMPEEHEAEMSLPFIGYTYKAFNAFQAN